MQRIVPGLFIAGLWLLLLLQGSILLFCFIVLGVVLFGADEQKHLKTLSLKGKMLSRM